MNFNLEPAELAKKITVMPDTKHQQPMQLSTPLLEDPRERGAYETACETLNFLSNYGVQSDVNLNKPDMKEEHFERTMTQKKRFYLYTDSLAVLEELEREQVGDLFLAIAAYHRKDNEELERILQDKTMRIVFAQFRNYFERDDASYQAECERRREAGSKGGRKRAENLRKKESGNTRTAAGGKSKQTVANVADREKDKEKDKDKDKDVVATEVADTNQERHSNECPKKDGLSLPSSPSSSSKKSEFESLHEWMKLNTPFVLKLDMQLTEDEYWNLRGRYSKTQITDGLRALNNWKQLPRKRTSVYQSLLDELRDREVRYARQK